MYKLDKCVYLNEYINADRNADKCHLIMQVI